MNDTGYWERVYERANLTDYPSSGPPDASLVEFCARYVEPPAPVLDLGCGGGRNARYLAAAGFAVTGVDIAAGALESCRRLFLRDGLQGHFAQGSLVNIPFEAASFAAVVCTNALDHVTYDEARTALREMSRVLVPGGVGLLTFDAVDTDEERLDEAEVLHDGTLHFVRGTQAGMVFRRYRDEEIRRLLAEADIHLFEAKPSGLRVVVYSSRWTGTRAVGASFVCRPSDGRDVSK